MTDVTPVSSVGSAAIGPAGRAATNKASPVLDQPVRGEDQVELSVAAKYLNKLHELPEFREDLISRVKQEISSDLYDSPDKIDALLEELSYDL